MKQKVAWQQLAKLHQLNFIRGRFLSGNYGVIGNYKEYKLSMSFNQTRLLTRIILSSKRKHKNIRSNPLTIEDMCNLLTPTDAPYTLKGLVKVDLKGRKVYYEQLSSESDVAYLQFVLDQLRNLIIAYPYMVALGIEAIPSLPPIAANTLNGLHLVALQVLKDIAQENRHNFGHRVSNLVCLRCLSHFQTYTVKNPLSLESISYYGCRICHQSQSFFRGKMVATLDNKLTALQYQKNGLLSINWLAHRSVFDFDAVHIVQATDEDVERFAVQVGNDTDPIRKPTYKQMHCIISPECKLSENTIRILRQIFGQVEVKQLPQL